jgi:exopolyphosphatase/guanosine-5'-triphosphate,3'-diphosphate pyrophosphatase
VVEIVTVATGVVREAKNQAAFLDAIRDHTGLDVRIITGEEEALLTGLGVCRALRIFDESFVIFDLGGGTTEFLIAKEGGARAFSLPLGGALYTHRFIRSDPPGTEEIENLEKAISAVLQAFHGIRPMEEHILVGTGGTVATLACLVHGVGVNEISPERMNGLTLAMTDLEGLLAKMKKMARQERIDLLGLDPERADVILAGFLMVAMIMRYFESSELRVSVSDLLEGALIDFLSGGGVDAKQGF